MVNILIVDDLSSKTQEILRVLDSLKTEDINIETAQDIHGAKRKLCKKNIDIMILDICLPRTFGSEPLQDGGLKLIKEIKASRSGVYSYPKYIISLSEYKESIESFSSEDGVVHTAINYNPAEETWEKELLDRVSIAITIVSNTTVRRAYDFDIAVICALPEEIECIRKGLLDVKKIDVPYDDDIYYQGYFIRDEQKIRVVISSAYKMGMVAATTLTTKMINNFIPKYVVMTGITGGMKRDKTNYGDILVAEAAWDYRAGKDVIKDGERKHLNTINQMSVDPTLISYCRNLAEDKQALQAIEESFDQGNKPETKLKMVIGPVVSGASVVTDPDIVKDVLDTQDRNVLGIEMEIYGVYYAASWAMNPKPKFIALKSVSDFADQGKADDYHKYASYTSAKAFEVLAKEYFTYDD